MEPYFNPGDHVFTFNWGKVKKGDAIVFNRHPEGTEGSVLKSRERDSSTMSQKDKAINYLIKRIDKIEGKLFFISGDNKVATSLIGPIKKIQIIGKVILKY